MNESLVITPDALQICLERASDDWFDNPICPDDGSWGVLSSVVGGNTFVACRTDSVETRKAVIIRQDGTLLGSVPGEARREMFQRVHRVLLDAADLPLRFPFGWSPFHHQNLVAFFACRRDLGAWRWVAEIHPDETQDVGFWLLTHPDNEMGLDEFSTSPLAKRARKLHSRICDAWEKVVEELGGRFAALPAAKAPEALQPAIDLEAATFGAVTKGQTYSGWIQVLTESQRGFVESDTTHSLKLRGPAGSGKTLALALKALRELYKSNDEARELRILFATHSWAIAEQVDETLRRLDERGIAGEIDVYPLLEIARERLPKEHSHDELGLLGHDSLTGRRLQLERINRVVDYLAKGDWLAYRDDVSARFREAVEADADSSERAGLIWDLMMEFASVLGAQGIFPGVQADRRYLALPRLSWMMPLGTEGEKRFVLRIYTAYVNELREEGVLTADQMINDFLSYLQTFTWNARRLSEGYDLVFVDELHLFSEQERLVLHYLARSADDYPQLFMALDPRQSPHEAYGFSGTPTSQQESGEAEEQLGDVESVELSSIYRFTPEILEFIRHIHRSYPALDFGEDWHFDPESLQSERAASGEKPRLYMYKNSAEEIQAVLDRGAYLSRTTSRDSRVAIVVLETKKLANYVRVAETRVQPSFTVIRGRNDVESLRYARRSVVLSAAEYTAGLQFSHVIVSGLPSVAERAPNAGYELRRFLSLMYLAVSRASEVVELHTNEGCGDLPEIVDSALKNGFLDSV